MWQDHEVWPSILSAYRWLRGNGMMVSLSAFQTIFSDEPMFIGDIPCPFLYCVRFNFLTSPAPWKNVVIVPCAASVQYRFCSSSASLSSTDTFLDLTSIMYLNKLVLFEYVLNVIRVCSGKRRMVLPELSALKLG